MFVNTFACCALVSSINEKMGHGCLSGLDSQEDVPEVSVPRFSDLVLFDPSDKHSDSEHLPKPASHRTLVASWGVP